MTKSQTMSVDSKKWGSAFMTPSRQAVASTTYIETDSSSFRELVQKLTGVSEPGGKLPLTMPARSEKTCKGSAAGVIKSDDNCFKSGIEMVPQKPAFKLHNRRQFHKKVQIKLGLRNDPDSEGDSYRFLPNLISSPITPLGHGDLFTHSDYCCSSYIPKSSYLEEEGQEFCLEASPNCLKREPELLPLFPLHSTTRPST
ncbi:hypothetical protein SUGI_0325120 [Cryptomeria japonica]|uniref:VQ motif-containing protein 11 n=1 Tax=Cryptomeria japonica TaxID=3369 RepID=UPI00240893B7|nr:VQ motif-containing protein 11 [Cryptomeria japonica]GLJ18369.1 hypothetical protein SUGI_0325120 [Cryptomeria japonica]